MNVLNLFKKNKKFNKIFLASDFLMTKDKEQFSNLRWFYDLLQRPITNATGIQPVLFKSSLIDTKQFIRKEFFKLSNIDLDINQTQFYYNSKSITDDSINYIKSMISEDTLIIAYEISETTREILDRCNITYIDIWLHPIRFLDDLLFAFSSNNKNINKNIEQYNMSEDTFYLYADRFKISKYKGHKRVETKVEKNSALFIGQTLEDKAVLKDGKMLNFLDFKTKIEEMSKQYSHIYYSRHPYVKPEQDKEIIDYINSLDYISLTHYPSYYLLADNNIKKVFSISSSVVHEAKYFDKDIEFLYKPIFNLNTINNKNIDNTYNSVYQKFISPSFWSHILSPIMNTYKVEEVSFLDGKDKLRDMLAFYYNYKLVDKNEQTRNTLIAVDRRIQNFEKKIKVPESITKNTISNKSKEVKESLLIKEIKEGTDRNVLLKKYKEKIACFDIISFDIFDTILVRDIDNPSNIFKLMDKEASLITNNIIKDFSAVRFEARGLVKHKNHGEEVELYERYIALGEKYNLSKEMVNSLYKLELEYEYKFLKPRPIMMELLEYAKSLNKKVIIISDIFYSLDIVKNMLEINNINKETHYDELYVSSDTKVLKHTGNMYEFVLNDIYKKYSLSAKNILHVGDNIKADVDNAHKYNITSMFIPKNIDTFNKVSMLSQNINYKDNKTTSIIKGVISNKISEYENEFSTPSYINGNPYFFGYSIISQIFMPFTKWLIDEAIKDNIDHLYFLARDGHIIKRCYDVIIESPYYRDKKVPKSTYLYASRRGINIPAIKTKEDVINLLKANFDNSSIKNISINRLGINPEKIDLKALENNGFKSINDIISFKNDKEKYLNLFSVDCLDIILDNAKEERKILEEYFEKENLYNKIDKKAIVDIGHNGSIQLSLSKIINEKISGYYYATFKDIEKNVIDNNMIAKGYIANKEIVKNSKNIYCKNILMFESIFVNDQASFKRMIKNNAGIIEPKFIDTSHESNRIDFIKDVHNGIVDYITDILPFIDLLNISVNESVNSFISFINNPTVIDANMYQNIEFENVYSGRDSKKMIYLKKDLDDTIKSSIWKKGASILFKYNKINGYVLMDKIIKKVVSNRKYNKWRKNPKQFFYDSKNPIAKALHKYY